MPTESIVFPHRHLLGLEHLSAADLNVILDVAVAMKQTFTRRVKTLPALRGKTVVTLFYENSTRTRTSFELAAKRLSADVLGFNVSTSSVQKGESLLDTVRTVEAMGADFIVMRHGAAGAPYYLSRNVASAVINAGDGTHEHPTQGLLDIFTIRSMRGGLAGLKVAIVGDIRHSRVARSNIWGLTKLGAEVRLIGPPTLVPPEFEELGCRIFHNLAEGLAGADVVNMLRIQLERQQANLFPSIREYKLLYGVTTERLREAGAEHALIMHPGPVNRGTEVSGDVADGPNSVINEQVTNGVAVRMAVLYLLGGMRVAPQAD